MVLKRLWVLNAFYFFGICQSWEFPFDGPITKKVLHACVEKLERHQHTAAKGATRSELAKFDFMLVDESIVWDAVALVIYHNAIVSIVLIVERYLFEWWVVWIQVIEQWVLRREPEIIGVFMVKFFELDLATQMCIFLFLGNFILSELVFDLLAA